MDSIRQNKVGRLIQRDLSEMFQKECKEFTAGAMLSVTAVRVSPDMSYARVYLSIFPSNLTEKVLESLAEQKYPFYPRKKDRQTDTNHSGA